MKNAIEGDFQRVGGKRRENRKRRNMAGLAGDTSSVGSWWWEFTHPLQVQEENIAITGTNDPYATGIYGDTGIAQFRQRLDDAIAKLDDASAKLDLAAQNLLSIQTDVEDNGTPEEQNQWQVGYARVQAAQNERNRARAMMQQASDWWSNSSGVVVNGLKNELRGLAALPVIPWALVAAIVAATAFIYAAAQAGAVAFNAVQSSMWNRENMRRQGAGQAPLQGEPQLLDTEAFGSGAGSIFLGLGNVAQWAVIGFGLYLLMGYMDKKELR